MNNYVVRELKLLPGMMTFDEYREAYNKAARTYCKGMKEVEQIVGGKLRRQRTGIYTGIIGNTEYVVEKC